MKKTIIISSLIIMAILLAEAVRENAKMDWQKYQKIYKEELIRLAATPKDKEAAGQYQIKMRQLVLPELNRVDRCVICHVAMEDARMADKANPLKSHPGNYLENHEVEKVGCTVCHDGQGRAITFKEAVGHAHDTYWEKPMLKTPYLEANCARCHRNKVEEITHYNRGKEIFNTLLCVTCHKLNGKGGTIGPDISNIGNANFHVKAPVPENRKELLEKFDHNINLAYLYESVTEPKAQPTDSLMADYNLSEEDAVNLVIFLKSLSTDPISQNVIPHETELVAPANVTIEATKIELPPPTVQTPVASVPPLPAASTAVTTTPAPEETQPVVVAAEASLPFSEQGKTIFNLRCIACHTIGGGRRVGPDLLGATDRRESTWLKSFIKFPSAMFKNNDPIATALLKEYVTPMTDMGLSDLEVDAVIAYIRNPQDLTQQTGAGPQAFVTEPLSTEGEQDALRGAEIYQGRISLFNRGPACNSCHEVTHQTVKVGGGTLARDLTKAYSRLGGSAGIKAILENPPFPAMNKSYAAHPVTQDEIKSLLAFLQKSDLESANQIKRDYGMQLFVFGIGGVAVLLGGYSVLWSGRRKKSVNQDIYDRQTKSQ